MAKRLEEIALNDEYFIERKLYPNVDSTRASSTRRWASHADVHPLFALGRIRAGSPTGGKWWRIRRRGSGDPASLYRRGRAGLHSHRAAWMMAGEPIVLRHADARNQAIMFGAFAVFLLAVPTFAFVTNAAPKWCCWPSCRLASFWGTRPFGSRP